MFLSPVQSVQGVLPGVVLQALQRRPGERCVPASRIIIQPNSHPFYDYQSVEWSTDWKKKHNFNYQMSQWQKMSKYIYWTVQKCKFGWLFVLSFESESESEFHNFIYLNSFSSTSI